MIENSPKTWRWYKARSREERVRWLRGLTPEQSFALYEDLYRIGAAQQDDSPGWRRLEQRRWEEKLALRLKLVRAFQALDRIRSERADSRRVE